MSRSMIDSTSGKAPLYKTPTLTRILTKTMTTNQLIMMNIF